MIIVESLESRVLLAATVDFVEDIFPGTGAGFGGGGVAFNGELYFAGTDPAGGRELWRSDGTPAGTKLVKDIFPGATSSNPSNLTVAGDRLYFSADDGTNGTELWVSNGTRGGTERLTDLVAGTGSASPLALLAAGNAVFFTANDDQGGGLYRAEGDTVERVNLPRSESGPPAPMAAINNRVLFQYTDSTDPTTPTDDNFELWSVNFNGNNPQMARDLADGFSSFPTAAAVVGDTLYFTAYRGADFASATRHLFKTDGTPGGTDHVRGIGATGAAGINAAVAVGKRLFFARNLGTSAELWVSDGTAEGTERLRTIAGGFGGISNLTNVSGTLFFVADETATGSELWTSDGTPASTKLVKDIRAGATGSSPSNLAALRGALYFAADDGASGRELWTSDGTADGTVLLQDIDPATTELGPFSSSPFSFTKVGRSLYFAANTTETGLELWRLIDNTACQCEDLQVFADVNKTRINEGDSVTFRATVTRGTADRFEWDFDNDGKFDDGSGRREKHTYLDNPRGRSLVVARVRVSARSGGRIIQAEDQVELRVENVAPTVSFDMRGGVYKAGRRGRIIVGSVGREIQFRGTVTDPGDDSVQIVAWDWGDGSSVFFQDDRGLRFAHTYNRQGVFPVTLSLEDDDGAVGTTTFRLPVVQIGEELFYGIEFVALVLGDDDDNVRVLPDPLSMLVPGTEQTEPNPQAAVGDVGQSIQIRHNGRVTTVDARKVTIFGAGGDDRLRVDPAVTIPVVLAGGAGNDTLAGGAGNDRLFGNAGNDSISGNGGKDRIAGNKGLDDLIGGPGKDKLLDEDDAADPLAALLR